MYDAYATNTLEYDPALCSGCWVCMAVCPHEVFARENGVVRVADAPSCMECGACQLNCPTGALKVDSGVGCAYGIILSALTGREDADCCGGRTPTSCCGDAEAAPAREGGSSCCGEPASGSADPSPAGEDTPERGTDRCCGG